MRKKNLNPKKEKSEVLLMTSLLKSLFFLIFIIIIIPSAIATVSMSIIANDNILLSSNNVQFLIESDTVFNGSINLMSSDNLALSQSTISFSELDFSFNAGKYLLQRSAAFNAISLGDYFIIANLMNYSGSNYTSMLTQLKTGKVVQSIDISPPQIISASPSGAVNHTNIAILIMTNENSTCRGSFQEEELSYENFEIQFIGNAESHTYNTTLPEENYAFYVKCRDFYNNTMDDSYVLDIIIDTTSPQITSFSPANTIASAFTTLSVTTNENAECRYSKSDSLYESMILMVSANKQVHTVQLENLSEGTNSFYVKCKDLIGNAMQQSTKIDINTAQPPTISISISKSSPLKAGIYEVTVTAAKNLQPTPTPALTYVLGSGSAVSIPLSGSGSIWKGFMIISSDAGNAVGSFYFSGKDYLGNDCEVISSGKIFLVDTIAPDKPVVEAFSNPDGSIRLHWRYDGEELKGFNIYRATSSGVTLLDFYSNTTANIYVDNNVIVGITYYYAVSAVDKADNEGGFSIEVYATSTKTSQPSSQTMSPQLIKKIDDTISILNNAVDKVDSRRKSLLERSEEEKRIFETTGILKEIEDIQTRLESLYSELNELKTKSMDEAQLKAVLSREELTIRSIEKTVPLDVKTTSLNKFQTKATAEDVADAVGRAKTELSSNAEYLKESTGLQDKIDIGISATLVSIVYESSTEDYALVEETLSPKEDINDSEVVVIIPKSISADTSTLEFLSTDYMIIEEDPVISWEYQRLSAGHPETISYLIKEKTSESELRGIKTVLLKKNYGQSSPKVTGNLIVKIVKSNANFLGIMTGIIIVGILVFYYLKTGKKDDKDNEDNELQNIIDGYPPTSQAAVIKPFGNFGKKEAKKTGSIPKMQNKNLTANTKGFSPEQISLLIQKLEEAQKNLSSDLPFNGMKNDEINESQKISTRQIPIEQITNQLPSSQMLSKNSVLNQAQFSNTSASKSKDADFSNKASSYELINEKYFLHLSNGVVLKNIFDLKNALEKMDSDTFNHHVNYERNDFAEWIRKSFNEAKLAREMKKVRSRQQALSILKDAFYNLK